MRARPYTKPNKRTQTRLNKTKLNKGSCTMRARPYTKPNKRKQATLNKTKLNKGSCTMRARPYTKPNKRTQTTLNKTKLNKGSCAMYASLYDFWIHTCYITHSYPSKTKTKKCIKFSAPLWPPTLCGRLRLVHTHTKDLKIIGTYSKTKGGSDTAGSSRRIMCVRLRLFPNKIIWTTSDSFKKNNWYRVAKTHRIP